MRYVRWVCLACRHPGLYYGIALPADKKQPVCPNQKEGGKVHPMVAK